MEQKQGYYQWIMSSVGLTSKSKKTQGQATEKVDPSKYIFDKEADSFDPSIYLEKGDP